MSDAPKFKTFRDLRSVPKVPEKEFSSSTSISRTSSIPSTTSLPSISRTSSSTSTPKKQGAEISPVRDFQKVPNSV